MILNPFDSMNRIYENNRYKAEIIIFSIKKVFRTFHLVVEHPGSYVNF